VNGREARLSRRRTGPMTDAGNRWAAEHIAAALRGR